MGGGKGVITSFPVKQTASRCRSASVCLFIGTYGCITQSAKVISSYCPMSLSGKKPMSCEGEWGWERGQYVQAVCLQTKAESRQCPGLWCQTRGSTVCWDSTISYLVLQRLRSAQTAAGGVGTSHGPCLLVTPSE